MIFYFQRNEKFCIEILNEFVSGKKISPLFWIYVVHLRSDNDIYFFKKSTIWETFSKTFCDWYLRFKGVRARYPSAPYICDLGTRVTGIAPYISWICLGLGTPNPDMLPNGQQGRPQACTDHRCYLQSSKTSREPHGSLYVHQTMPLRFNSFWF